MGKNGKVAVIILVILFISALALAGGVFYLLQQEHGKTISLQKQLDDLKERQRVTEKQLQESMKTAADLGAKLKDVQMQLDSVNEELKQAKADKESALNRVQELEKFVGQANDERAQLEDRLTAANEDIKKAQDGLKELQAQKTSLETKVKELQAQTQGVELGKIVVSSDAKEAPKKEVKKEAKAETKEKKGFFSSFFKKKAAPESPKAKQQEAAAPAPVVSGGHEGKVLVINKEYNFAVISLGSRDGIRTGDNFAVYHNGNYIGDLVIEKLHDSMAAANFVNSDLKDKLVEGDKVVQKK